MTDFGLCGLRSYTIGSDNHLVQEERVSGNIVAVPFDDGVTPEKEFYIVRNPDDEKGWTLSVYYLNPDDLRVLADRIETKRQPETLS